MRQKEGEGEGEKCEREGGEREGDDIFPLPTSSDEKDGEENSHTKPIDPDTSLIENEVPDSRTGINDAVESMESMTVRNDTLSDAMEAAARMGLLDDVLSDRCGGVYDGASSELWDAPVSGGGEWDDINTRSDAGEVWSQTRWSPPPPPSPLPEPQEVECTPATPGNITGRATMTFDNSEMRNDKLDIEHAVSGAGSAPFVRQTTLPSSSRSLGTEAGAATDLARVSVSDVFDGHWPRRCRRAVLEAGRSSIEGSADIDWKEVAKIHILGPSAGPNAWLNAAAELITLRRYREAVWCCFAVNVAAPMGGSGTTHEVTAARIRALLCAARALLALGRTGAAQAQLSRLLTSLSLRQKQSRRGANHREDAESASGPAEGGDGPVAAALREEEAAGDWDAAAAAARRAMMTVARVECHVGRACGLVDGCGLDGAAAAKSVDKIAACETGKEDSEAEARGRHAVILADRIQVMPLAYW